MFKQTNDLLILNVQLRQTSNDLLILNIQLRQTSI